MKSTQSLIGRTILAAGVVILSALLVAPNFTRQKLAIGFRQTVRDAAGVRQQVAPEVIQDFIRDRENGLRFYFPRSECVPEASETLPIGYRCVLSERFITTARVNELVQAFPDLIDEHETAILPDGIERFFGMFSDSGVKDLKVKLGLDLQGGMRAVFRADFESYLARIREKNTPEIASIEQKLANPALAEAERTRLQSQLESLKDELELTGERKSELLQEAKTIIDKRLAAQGLTEPEVRAQPESFSIAVDMPGVANSNDVLAKIKDTVTVEYRIVNDEATARVQSDPANLEDLQRIKVMFSEGRADPVEVQELLNGIAQRSALDPEREGRLFLFWRRAQRLGDASPMLPREFRVLGPPVMDGSDMSQASASHNPDSSYFMINFRLTEAGSTRFGDLTEQNVDKRMAILWGDRVVSDPAIREPIYGGSGQITGDFSMADANEISAVIREGALPMPLEVISVSFVGPSLGQESIVNGVISVALGFLVVILFMLGYYKWSGAVAVVALFLNLLLMAAVMSLLEFTLTLPGFAGAILTVGMAVDANVIIFEKMKEDLRAGKSATVAIESGYEASLWTILDSNITTLIAAIILYLPKDGPIMGFAIVLFFGLVSSMFTALFVTRVIYGWLYQGLRFRKLSIGYGFGKEAAA